MNKGIVLAIARRLGVALVLGSIGGHGTIACNDRVPEPQACYPEAIDWELDHLGYPRGWCQWPDGEVPDDAPPMVNLQRFVHCFDLEEGQACDACPAEETDELLREEFAASCGYEGTYFARGCYWLKEGDDGQPRCCYMALIGPACTTRD